MDLESEDILRIHTRHKKASGSEWVRISGPSGMAEQKGAETPTDTGVHRRASALTFISWF